MQALRFLIGACLSLTVAAATEFHGATPLEWSKRMADSEMRRLGDSLFHENPDAKWTYTTGLLGEAYLKLAAITGSANHLTFGARAAESFIEADGTISRYKLEDYNIDLVTPGKVLLHRWQSGHRPEASRVAIETLRRQMREHPRTKAGGFWHKKRYPHQMWLDGLYMASPFLAQYAGLFDEPALYDEVVKQLTLVDQYTWDPKRNLHIHAWDESRQQPWTDKQTGRCYGIELTSVLGENATTRGWKDVDAVLARIKAPVFTDREFPITDFGATKDANSTKAIRSAIEDCHKAGGGRVVIPEGRWLTGAITLLTNVNLHLCDGATLEWTFNLDDYPVVFTRFEGMECMNFSPLIYAFGQENIAITGKGTLDGGASNETWWGWSPKDPELRKKGPSLQKKDRDTLGKMIEEGLPVGQRVFGKGHYLRPSFIQPYRCRNILIEGVTIIRSPMWEVHPVLSENITVRGLTITTHGPNNDGCDPESCRDVLIEDTLFDTGDDCIAIKSGRNEDGRRINVPSENIMIRNCTMKDGHGGVVLGSECSGHIRNVWVENCVMDSPNLDRALRFKNNAQRGGILENVFMRKVKIGQVAEAVLTIDLLYEEGSNGDHQAIVRNVDLDNISSAASPRVMFIRGYEGAIIDDIRIRNSMFHGVTDTEVLEHAGSIQLQNVDIVPSKGLKPRNTVPKQ